MIDVNERRATRRRFVGVLGLAGVLLGLPGLVVVTTLEPGTATGWLMVVTPLGGAATATLLHDVAVALLGPERPRFLLSRLVLTGMNGTLFLAELLVLLLLQG